MAEKTWNEMNLSFTPRNLHGTNLKLPHRKFVWKKNFFCGVSRTRKARSGTERFGAIPADHYARSFCMGAHFLWSCKARVLERVLAGTRKKD